jgi:hypothetical protein
VHLQETVTLEVGGQIQFDLVAQCLRVTRPVEAGLIPAPPQIIETGAAMEIVYELPVPKHFAGSDGLLLLLAENFASAHGDRSWAARYELGIGSILLANVPRRLASGDEVQRQLGVIALAEGLRMVWEASQAT